MAPSKEGDAPVASAAVAVTIADKPVTIEPEAATGSSSWAAVGSTSLVGSGSRDIEIDPEDRWEGLLAFLNEPCCYVNPDDDDCQSDAYRIVRSSTWVERRSTKAKAACKRLRAAFTKKGQMKRLPESAILAHWRNMVGEVVLSPAVQGMVLVIIGVDVAVTIWKFASTGFQDNHQELSFQLVIDWMIVLMLALEVVSRVFYFGKSYTHSILNLLEFALVPTAIFELSTRGKEGERVLPMLRTLRPILRSVNLLLKGARGLSRVTQFRTQLQLQVSGNRRRYRMNGFDLDLCYLGDSGKGGGRSQIERLIAMGRPAIGCDAFYNNPLNEVAKFFDTMHANRFLVINVSEKIDYPVEPLHHRVVLFPVQETCVPKLIELWDVCATMREFLARENHVVAVHSRIGGGCVGLVMAAYLLYSNATKQAADAINYYERRLTDPSAKETVSGIDTASQQRFMEYFSVCVRELRYVPDPPRKARLRNIKLLGVEPEIASLLSVRCFAHGMKTAARSVFKPTQVQRVNSQSSDITRPREGHEEQAKKNEEAVLMLMDEDDLLEQAQKAREAGVFDSYTFGCRPQQGTPLLDTADASRTGDGFEQMDLMQSEVVVWQIDSLELTGEICFEIHQRELPTDAAPQGDSKLLLATWLHTSFLEMSAGSQGAFSSNNEVNVMSSRSVCVTLQRFDLDKGANAPSLRSYGSSFEVQLLFEVDELMEYRWGSTQSSDDLEAIERVTGRRHNTIREQTVKLVPPSDADLSDEFSASWMTWIVRKLWPSIDCALLKLAKEEVEKITVPTPVGEIPVNLECFSLGTQTPELGPIYASERSGVRAGLQLDLSVCYKGDANIQIQSGTSRIGVTHIGIKGTVSLLFDPIVNVVPIVGGVHIFFLNPPKVELQFVGLADPLNYHFLRNIIDTQFNLVLADNLVLPNVLTLNWMPDRIATADRIESLSTMLPTGVLRIVTAELEPITPAECRCGREVLANLKCRPKGPSRYVVVRLGTKEGHQELQPQQKQVGDIGCDLLVYDRKQNFTLEIWEREYLGKPRLLATSPVDGSHQLTLQDLIGSRGSSSQWLPLENFAGDLGSRVRVRTKLFELHADKKQLQIPGDEGQSPPRGFAGAPSRAFDATPPKDDDDEGDLPTLDQKADAFRQRIQQARNDEREFDKLLFDERTTLSDKEAASADDDPAVALLIVSLFKGRVPLDKGEEATGYNLRVSVDSDNKDERPFTPRDTEFWKEVQLSETTTNTIEELSVAGFPAERIAAMLKMEKELVAKVMAYRLEFNVELRKHLCVFVPVSALHEESHATFQVVHGKWGYEKAQGSVSLSSLWRANGMKQRSLVNLKPDNVTESDAAKLPPKKRFDLDVEVRLLAFVQHSGKVTHSR